MKAPAPNPEVPHMKHVIGKKMFGKSGGLSCACLWIFILFAAWPAKILCDEEKNLALGKPCQFGVPPNYPLCTDADDARQLTDGVRVVGGMMWVDKGCVGWFNMPRFIPITVDLGGDCGIKGVALSTAGGAGDVGFPKNIFVLVSVDGKEFYLAGDLVKRCPEAPSPETRPYTSFTYRSADFKTHGRYVRFLMNNSRGAYQFLDEIEVYAGDPAWTKLSYDKSSRLVGDEIPKKELIETGCQIRCRKDIKEILQKLEVSSAPVEKKMMIRENLQKLAAEIPALEFKGDAGTYKSIVPVHALEERILRENAALMNAEGLKPVVLWHGDPYAPLSHLQQPGAPLHGLEVTLAGNEFRSEAFNLTNTSQENIRVQFKVKGFPVNFQLRQVELVDCRTEKVTSIVLPLLTEKDGVYTVDVSSGMTRQVWMTCDSTDARAGDYTGTIQFLKKGLSKIAVRFHISPVRLSEENSLEVGVFDYAINFSGGIRKENLEMARQDMKRHGVNVAWGTRKQACFPIVGDLDENGHWIKKVHFEPFEEWVNFWPDARHYHIYAGVSDQTEFGGFKRGTPAFHTAVAEWGRAWDEHLVRKGWGKGRLRFHFRDEPRTPQGYQTLGEWVAPFKALQQNVEVWADPNELSRNGNVEGDAPPAWKALGKVDVLCFPVDQYFLECDKAIKDYLRAKNKEGVALELYQCDGPLTDYDPVYSRSISWRCFHEGFQGFSQWDYSVGTAWDEYLILGGKNYSLVWSDGKEIVPTKHWEALREGIQDYKYLCLLREKIDKMSAEELSRRIAVKTQVEAADFCRRLAEDALSKTATLADGKKDYLWKESARSRPLEEARRQVLLLLEKLDDIH